MNCGIQGVHADPSTLSNAYATSPGGVAAPMEQRISHWDRLRHLWFFSPRKKQGPLCHTGLIPEYGDLPSGYVKIAIEHGPVEIVDLPIANGDFP